MAFSNTSENVFYIVGEEGLKLCQVTFKSPTSFLPSSGICKWRGKKPWTVIDDWSKKEQAPTHFFNLMNALHRQFSKVLDCEVVPFLIIPVDLDVISHELAKLGITKTTLMNPPHNVPPANRTNKAIIDIESYLT
ncbi:hypothetical protein PoB_005188800 [Plakobranchus ocellatus]|uniref:Uncharacterized protein n=1 Tax=Plakobranchus ocellatus TaxID=259542 RepID=A0AAV4C1S8_9GAST|nr:hypothetical protein PoB_005188800 [Plakobranchus ocellatus]